MPLSDLIQPLPLDDFLSDHVGQCAVHCNGRTDRHAGLFSWDALDALLNAAPAPHPALRLVSAEHGAVVPDSAAQAIAALRQNMGLVVQEADRYDAQLATLADALTAELDEPCRINVYATRPAQPAFPLHADTHDVLVLHIAGQKQWSVTGPSLVDPLFHASLHPQTPPADPAPYLTATLTPGDTLYIPRGHWHQAMAMHGPSLHLTVAIFRTTGMDLITHLAQELFGSATWRAALPMAVAGAVRHHNNPAGTEQRQQRDWAHDLATRMSDPHLLARYRAARLAHEVPRQPFRVAAHLGAATARRWRAQPGPVRIERRDDGLLTHVAGRDLWLPLAAEPALQTLFDGRPFALDDLVRLAPELPTGSAARIVDDLVAEGILRPAIHPSDDADTA